MTDEDMVDMNKKKFVTYVIVTPAQFLKDNVEVISSVRERLNSAVAYRKAQVAENKRSLVAAVQYIQRQYESDEFLSARDDRINMTGLTRVLPANTSSSSSGRGGGRGGGIGMPRRRGDAVPVVAVPKTRSIDVAVSFSSLAPSAGLAPTVIVAPVAPFDNERFFDTFGFTCEFQGVAKLPVITTSKLLRFYRVGDYVELFDVDSLYGQDNLTLQYLLTVALQMQR
jgi:hypothetical protein